MKRTSRIIRHTLATLAGALIAAAGAEPIPASGDTPLARVEADADRGEHSRHADGCVAGDVVLEYPLL